MKYRSIVFSLLILLLLSCSEKKEKKPIVNTLKNNKEQIIDLSKKNEDSIFHKIIHKIKIKTIPLIDSTNFDNFKKKNFYNKQEVSILQLEKIYPEFYNEGYYYKTTSSYRIELSNDFYSIILTSFKGDQEIESALVNYDLKGKIIDYKIISYDEIAEGVSRIESKVEKNKLTIKNVLWMDEKQETTATFLGGFRFIHRYTQSVRLATLARVVFLWLRLVMEV